jgi:hypothetical protein
MSFLLLLSKKKARDEEIKEMLPTNKNYFAIQIFLLFDVFVVDVY